MYVDDVQDYATKASFMLDEGMKTDPCASKYHTAHLQEPSTCILLLISVPPPQRLLSFSLNHHTFLFIFISSSQTDNGAGIKLHTRDASRLQTWLYFKLLTTDKQST